jgi:hypothetical protein
MSDEEEQFINSEKALLVINLLTKHKIKLWELPNIDQIEQFNQEQKSQIEVSQIENKIKFFTRLS